MNIDALTGSVTTPRTSLAPEQVNKDRKQAEDASQELATVEEQKSVQPEELINQIKSLTDDGLYSVRFESNESDQLIVKVVDRETNEVIRQIPPEELLELTKHLNEISGSLVDTVG
jgi:flagellar protein FlaG